MDRVRLFIFFFLLSLFSIVLSCGGGGGGGGGTSLSGSMQLAWDASTDSNVTGYKIYYGQNSMVYDRTADAGAATIAQDNSRTFQLTGLTPGQTYYCVVTCYSSDDESEFSNEISGAAN